MRRSLVNIDFSNHQMFPWQLIDRKTFIVFTQAYVIIKRTNILKTQIKIDSENNQATKKNKEIE